MTETYNINPPKKLNILSGEIQVKHSAPGLTRHHTPSLTPPQSLNPRQPGCLKTQSSAPCHYIPQNRQPPAGLCRHPIYRCHFPFSAYVMIYKEPWFCDLQSTMFGGMGMWGQWVFSRCVNWKPNYNPPCTPPLSLINLEVLIRCTPYPTP